MRARRSRVVGSVRGVGSVPASGGAHALAAAMLATIEREFQEIEATNDWQARYLVSKGGRSGSAPSRRAAARVRRGPPVGSAGTGTRRLSGERKLQGPGSVFRCTQGSCGQALRMRRRAAVAFLGGERW